MGKCARGRRGRFGVPGQKGTTQGKEARREKALQRYEAITKVDGKSDKTTWSRQRSAESLIRTCEVRYGRSLTSDTLSMVPDYYIAGQTRRGTINTKRDGRETGASSSHADLGSLVLMGTSVSRLAYDRSPWTQVGRSY